MGTRVGCYGKMSIFGERRGVSKFRDPVLGFWLAGNVDQTNVSQLALTWGSVTARSWVYVSFTYVSLKLKPRRLDSMKVVSPLGTPC